MHVHILGICGTFMGGVAQLARAAGHHVTGCDANVYPPMSELLRSSGIEVIDGYDRAQTALAPDLYVIGNVITRANPLMEAILDAGAPFVSGPQWVGENLLRGRWVLAVAGTHGKTTVSAMLAAILDHAGLAPGFLIGGVPADFGVSARAGRTGFFVIEADEYDTAFFDKRSKFVHYFPRTAVLNNLEFDHADIFPDLAAIETQFHHLVRTVPGRGRLIVNGADAALARVLARGRWSELEQFDSEEGWRATAIEEGRQHAFDVAFGAEHFGRLSLPLAGAHNRSNALAAIAAARHAGVAPEVALARVLARGCWSELEQFDSEEGWRATAIEEGRQHSFDVAFGTEHFGRLSLPLAGAHNRSNALAAIAAARHAGVAPEVAIEALQRFRGVRRRLEVRGVVGGVTVYDDFAHHPTAIETTVAGLRRRVGTARILAVLEPRSNTMKLGAMSARLPASLQAADLVFCFGARSGKNALGWEPAQALAPLGARASSFDDLGALVGAVAAAARPGDHVLVMSNGGFGGVHDKLLTALAGEAPRERAA